VLRGEGQQGQAEACLREARRQLTSLMNELVEKSSVSRELAACELELAELFEANKNWQQAEAVYRQAATHADAAESKARPGPEVTWLRAQIATRLGNLLFDNGRRSEGKAMLAAALSVKERVAAAHPRIAGYQAELAWSLLDCRDIEQRNLPRAVEFASHAIALRPQDAGAWLVRGAALYRVGRCQEAVAALEKSSQLDRSGQSAVCYYLALSYQKLDKAIEARNALTKAESRFAASKTTDHSLTELREETRQALSRLSSLPTTPAPVPERTNG
jgi:predicted Zn-dependent protease